MTRGRTLGTRTLGTFFILILLAAGSCSAAEKNRSKRKQKHSTQPTCAKKCFEKDCDNVNIRYGKFCGVGHTGCASQEPCDEADACCKAHDECVSRQGVLASSCHADFISCLDQVMLGGSKGFSKKCPYSTVIPVMQSGISLTMALGDTLGGLFKEL